MSALTPDPQHESRARWRWCVDCQALREGWHRHGDPLEQKSWEQLLDLARAQPKPFNPPRLIEPDDGEAAFLDSVAKDCHCRTGVVCAGVQQGAPCDDLGPDPDRICLACHEREENCSCPPNEDLEP